MSAGARLSQPKFSEWLHSGRYLLIALLLHGLVLFYPLRLSLDQHEATPPGIVQLRLTENVSAARAVQPATPQKPSATPAPQRKKTAQASHPVLALAPEQVSAPAAFTVPAPATVLPAAPGPAPVNVASRPVTAPRFDAAYLHNPEPKYPSISRRLGEEGKVLLRVRVAPDGHAATVDVEKSSNFERLDEAARQVVARWRFVPARQGDDAIESTVIVPIVFRLDN